MSQSRDLDHVVRVEVVLFVDGDLETILKMDAVAIDAGGSSDGALQVVLHLPKRV